MAGEKKAWKVTIKVWDRSKNKPLTKQALNDAVKGSAIFLPLPRHEGGSKKEQPKDEEMAGKT